jgi:hypothetical protein
MDPEENSFEDSRVSDVDAVPSEFAFSAPKVHRKLPPMYAKLFGSVDAGPLQPTESCQDAIEEFKAILAKRADDRAKSHESYKVIPQFYFRKVRSLWNTGLGTSAFMCRLFRCRNPPLTVRSCLAFNVKRIDYIYCVWLVRR